MLQKAKQILRDRDLISRVELSAFDQHALTSAEIKIILVEPLEPCVRVTAGEIEE